MQLFNIMVSNTIQYKSNRSITITTLLLTIALFSLLLVQQLQLLQYLQLLLLHFAISQDYSTHTKTD